MQQDVGANLMGVSYIRRNDAHFLLFWGYQFRFYRFSFPPAMQERNELSRASLELVLSWNNTGLTLAEPFYADGELCLPPQLKRGAVGAAVGRIVSGQLGDIRPSLVQLQLHGEPE
eukprot:746644-Hanusia_phi.AAC.3